MENSCSTIIFSNKAYNELIRESFAKDPVETGGLLLGYVVDSTWVVMEAVPPGYCKSIHERAYFEYDQEFVNYMIPAVANRYKDPLQLLGLWHRHPGSMDYFSSTDDETNAAFAANSLKGTISGLVNIDPMFRLTMYHLDHFQGARPRNVAYTKVDVEVGDDFIPEEFFALRYVDGEHSELHPRPTQTNTHAAPTRSVPRSPRNEGAGDVPEQEGAEVASEPAPHAAAGAKRRAARRKWMVAGVAAAVFALGVLTGVAAAPVLTAKKTTKTEKTTCGKPQQAKPTGNSARNGND